MTRIAFLAVGLICLSAPPSAADDDREVLALAEHAEWLENQGELYRSASWYLWAFHRAGTGPQRDRAAMGVVRVHRRGEQWKDAVLWGQRVREAGLSETARASVALDVSQSLLRLNRQEDALRELRSVSSADLRPEERCRHRVLHGYALLATRQIASARQVWEEGAADSTCGESGMAKALGQASEIERGSRLMAGSLALVPGLGYLVTGQKQTALAAFLVNGLLIGGAIESFQEDLDFLGATFSVFALGWYTGSIYGSVRSVDRAFERQWGGALAEVDLESR